MLVENIEDRPQGSDVHELSADLLEAARRRNLSKNSLAAYERTWTRFLAWAAASSFDPRGLPSETARSCFLAPGPATRKPKTRPNQREKPKTALTAARGFCKLRKSWSKVVSAPKPNLEGDVLLLDPKTKFLSLNHLNGA